MARAVRRQWKDCLPLPSEGRAWLPLSTDTDPGTGISLSPGSWRRSLQHRKSAPARNSDSVAESDARLLRLERAMAEDVTHCLRRERAPSSAAEVHEDCLCPDTWHPEYDLHARVVRPSGKTSHITDMDAVSASGAPAIRAVAILMTSSSFQAH